MIVSGIGRVAEDVTLQKSPKGVGYVSVGLAETPRFGDKEEPYWYQCVAFGELGERMANAKIKKGSALMITGILSFEKYVDKDKIERKRAKVYVLDWSFVSTGKSKTESEVSSEEVAVSADDELPLA